MPESPTEKIITFLGSEYTSHKTVTFNKEVSLSEFSRGACATLY